MINNRWLISLLISTFQDLMLQLAAMEAPQAAVRVMAYPKSMERYIVENLPLGWDLHPVNYTQTLFVVHVSPTCLRFTLRPAEETYLTSPDGPTRVEGQLCRAEGKLTEALMVTGFEPGAGAAIDVGAAPGGWTAQLARSMHLVAAVDPAELDTQVAALPNVVHIKAKSEDATDQIKAAVGEHGVDLVVCDANKHPEQLLMMLEPLLELLPSGGLVIFTLKFRGRGKDKKLGAGKLLGDLEKLGYRDIKLLWLLANTVHERTVVAVKR